ncbi:MAG: hypothetical protein IJI42_06300 [Methanobrevibacter sp.]|nr:hypothetical protein [Methanobrevibacter sp.]
MVGRHIHHIRGFRKPCRPARIWGYVQKKDLKTLVEISSPDANETSKMIRSLTFK